MFSLFDGNGKKKVGRKKLLIFCCHSYLQEGTPIMVDVAGPLCFQGDYQVADKRLNTMIKTFQCSIFKAKDVELPPPEDGDILAIHDTGAYTMSMYCK